MADEPTAAWIGSEVGPDDPTAVTPTPRPDAPSPRIAAELPEADVIDDDDDTNVRTAVAGAVAAVLVVVLALVGWSVFVRGDDGGSALRSFELPDATLPTSTVPTTTVPPTAAPPTAPPTTGAPATVAPLPPPTSAPATAATAPPATAAPTTPAATEPPTTPPATSPATTVPPSTLAPGDVPGDLGIEGRAMSRPPCDGGFITVVGSATGPDISAEAVEAVLDQYPDSDYLRTDQTCPSLRQSIDGNPVYVVYFGPYSVPENACAERSRGPADSYVRSLSTELPPDHTVECPA